MEIPQQPRTLHDIPSISTSLERLDDIQTLKMSVAQLSPEKVFENKRIPIEYKVSFNNESEVKRGIKRKPRRNYCKKLLNCPLHEFLTPKSVFMLFDEVFQGIEVKVQKHPENHLNRESYTATIEIDSQFYVANDISMDVAREKACEKCVRDLFANKISKLSEENEKSLMEIKMKDGNNGTVPIPGCLKDFPWQLYAKLAMHNLINEWEIKDASKASNVLEEHYNKAKKEMFPSDPGNYNPIQLIHIMKPDVEYKNTILCSNSLSLLYQVNSEIDGVTFVGQGSSKKAAKKECCIAAIKHLWNFDFHTTY